MPRTSSAFHRPVAATAAAGVVAALSMLGAPAASAAVPDDCAGHTLDASTNTASDIQDMLDAAEPLICLRGTFVLGGPLALTSPVYIYGLDAAVLDGNGNRMIDGESAGASAVITIDGIRMTNGFQGESGIAIRAYSISVLNSTIDHMNGNGGAIDPSSDLYVENSLFEDNYANVGAAITFANAEVTVVDSTFRSNSARDIGGAIFGKGVLTVTGSTFEDNTAGYYGAAVHNYEGETTVTNSTFVDTSGDQYSTVFLNSGSISQSTFVNSTDTLAVLTDVGGGASLRGNIFASSTSTPRLSADSVFVDQGGNIFSSSQASETGFVSGGSSLFDRTPAAVFGSNVLADNGGPTFTIALAAGSPALRAVPAAASTVTTDQRGNPRFAPNDAGAVQVSPALPAPELAATGVAAGPLAAVAAALLTAAGLAFGVTRRRARGSAAE